MKKTIIVILIALSLIFVGYTICKVNSKPLVETICDDDIDNDFDDVVDCEDSDCINFEVCKID